MVNPKPGELWRAGNPATRLKKWGSRETEFALVLGFLYYEPHGKSVRFVMDDGCIGEMHETTFCLAFSPVK